MKDVRRFLKEKSQKLQNLKSSNAMNDNTVQEILCEEHADRRPLHPNTLSNPPFQNDSHPAVLKESTVPLSALPQMKSKGSAGPSGLDAKDWRPLCTA